MEKLQIFQRLSKKLKFLRKFLQNFVLCREIPRRSKIDFWRDYQQILKKHKKAFHENYQRNLKQQYENFGRIFSQFSRHSILEEIKKTVSIFLDN